MESFALSSAQKPFPTCLFIPTAAMNAAMPKMFYKKCPTRCLRCVQPVERLLLKNN